MGGDIGCHPNGNAAGAIQQQVWQPRWHHRWFLLGTIKIVDKIDGFGLDVLQQAVGGERLQPGFGVSHRRRWIVIH